MGADEATVIEALGRAVAQLPGGGEARPGQARMAAAVSAAIAGERHLVVQAGTGTGKSLAYLVPAVLAGRRVVVATATKALQDQLAGKDLPFLARALRSEFTFAVLKGRGNYLCRQRVREVSGGDDQLELADTGVGELGREIGRLLEWEKETLSGDRAELPFEPRPRAWSSLSVSSTECPGAARCPSGEDCFAEAARRRAEAADVVVVNTHLYAAHLASGGQVLPEHDVVVFDEAQELEDVCAANLGVELGGGRLRALARTVRPLLTDAELAGTVDDAADRLEAAMAPSLGRRLPGGVDEPIGAVLTVIADRLTRVTSAVRASDGDAARKARALQSAGHLAADVGLAQRAGDDDVVWVEGPPHAPVLRVAPVDVGGILAERLWDSVTAVLTSATVPPGLARRVGMGADDHDELDVGSPFPYDRHALLYCATHLPSPRRGADDGPLHDELEWLITAAGGRALALFTSYRALRSAVDALRPRLDVAVLAQDDLPKPALVAAFASDETSCLFATLGFFSGIDVPGRSLSLVTIDRIPFPRPDDPLTQARRDRAGAAAFRSVDLARAATLLAQGAGRLVRTAEDRGVVAVLDPRLAKAGYRWDLVRALPPMRRTRHRHEVEAFLTEVLAQPA